MAIDALPTVPQSTAPTTFAATMDAFLAALPTFRTQANALEVNVEAKEALATQAAADAAASAVASALNLGTYKGVWSAVTTYAQGESVQYASSFWLSQVGANLNNAPVEGADWAEVHSLSVVRVARDANTILGVTDKGRLVDATANSWTQTFSAATALGAGWWCYYRNSGTGDITLDPDGAELIDGLASFVMYPGEARLIQCDGAALRSFVLHPFSKTFTATAAFVKPPGYGQFGGLAWSAGSSGKRTNNVGENSAGGGGGGCFPFTLSAVALAASETVTIGAGGAAVTGVANGNVGGNTSFGSLFTVYGSSSFNRGGAIGYSSAAIANASGVAYGFETCAGTSGGNAVYGGGGTNTAGSSPGGSSIYGGGGGGTLENTGTVYAPGTSTFGGAGGVASVAASGTAGTVPGGGGGATQTGAASGAGARGELRIWGIA